MMMISKFSGISLYLIFYVLWFDSLCFIIKLLTNPRNVRVHEAMAKASKPLEVENGGLVTDDGMTQQKLILIFR